MSAPDSKQTLAIDRRRSPFGQKQTFENRVDLTMPIRLTPKARVAILSGLDAHMARSDLTPICMAESASTQAAEHHEPARAGLLGANRIGMDLTTPAARSDRLART
jgi:hypothetical protein